MRAAIEALEGRTLFAARGGGAALIARAEASSDPAVQATLELVQADQAAVQSARQEIASAVVESGPTLRSILRAGVDLIAADREDIRNSKGDPEALATAKAKLKADREQFRATWPPRAKRFGPTRLKVERNCARRWRRCAITSKTFVLTYAVRRPRSRRNKGTTGRVGLFEYWRVHRDSAPVRHVTSSRSGNLESPSNSVTVV